MSRFLNWLLLCALVATACGTGDIDHVRIGVLAPMSGPRAWIGQQVSAGVELAVEDLNAEGGLLGRDVESVMIDDSDLSSIPGQLSDLAERARVTAIVGPESAGVLLGPRSPLTRRDVPAMLASAFAGDLSQAATTVIRTVPSARDQATALGRWLVERRQTTNVALLTVDPIEGDLAADDLRDGLATSGVDVVASVRGDGDVGDLRPTVASLRDEVQALAVDGPVAVYVWGPPASSAQAVLAIRDLDWDVQIAVSAACFAAEFRTLGQDATEGVVMVFPFDWGWFSGPVVPWLIRYNTRHGIGLLPQLDTLVVDIPVEAVAAYDAVKLVAAAVREADSNVPADIAASLPGLEVAGLLKTYDLDGPEAWSADELYIARFHGFALTFDVDGRQDLAQQRRFWDAQVSLDLFEDEAPPAIAAIIRRVLEERSIDPPTYLDPLPPPGPVGRPAGDQ